MTIHNKMPKGARTPRSPRLMINNKLSVIEEEEEMTTTNDSSVIEEAQEECHGCAAMYDCSPKKRCKLYVSNEKPFGETPVPGGVFNSAKIWSDVVAFYTSEALVPQRRKSTAVDMAHSNNRLKKSNYYRKYGWKM